jgi:hypothetical protein
VKLRLEKWCPEPLRYWETTDERGIRHRVRFFEKSLYDPQHPDELVGRYVVCALMEYGLEVAPSAYLVPAEGLAPEAVAVEA